MKIEAEDVVRYLKDQPDFFEQHISVLLDLKLPNLHDEKAISLSEYQVAALREKNALLESKLRELIKFGEENDALGDRVHRFSLALLMAANLDTLLQAIYFNLREDFAVPHVVLRVWRGNGHTDLPEFAPVSAATREFAASLSGPYCSNHAMVDTATLFGEAAPHLRSFSYVPLRSGEAFGLLALASEDPQRFYPEMGTVYLKRLGEMAAAALVRHLDEG